MIVNKTFMTCKSNWVVDIVLKDHLVRTLPAIGLAFDIQTSMFSSRDMPHRFMVTL